MVQSTEAPPADFQKRPNGPQQLKGLVVDGNIAQGRRQDDMVLEGEVVHLHRRKVSDRTDRLLCRAGHPSGIPKGRLHSFWARDCLRVSLQKPCRLC